MIKRVVQTCIQSNVTGVYLLTSTHVCTCELMLETVLPLYQTILRRDCHEASPYQYQMYDVACNDRNKETKELVED